MHLFALAAICLLPAASPVMEWSFDTEVDMKAWPANSFLANVTWANGAVSADAIDWDPFFTCRDIEFAATPWQFVVLRMKASKPGSGELFWSGQTTGQYGGLSQEKRTPFTLRATGDWEDVVLFPGWQSEGVIRQMRLDVYDGAHFEIDSIRVMTWGKGAEPVSNVTSWTFEQGLGAWNIDPAADVFFAPRLRLDASALGWVVLRMSAERDGSASVVWTSEGGSIMQSQEFAVRGGGKSRYYNIELAGNPGWKMPVLAFGIRPPKEGAYTVESVGFFEEPQGPPDTTVAYLGFENGVNRAGRTASVLAQLRNSGGAGVSDITLTLGLPDGVRLVEGTAAQTVPALDYDVQTMVAWRVITDTPGAYPIRVEGAGEGAPEPVEASLTFVAPLEVVKADYVPAPRPVETVMDVCMYYFPGWNSPAKWDCIRNVAPIRKPLLGYYDEANPECVDWQIKWAAENGVKCYLVDWYWCAGHKSLEHWFDAYRNARYREYLDVAIMWANHNPPNTHSPEDWRKVTQEWIDRYFNLDTYYQVDGKPAVFIWSPSNIRNDLGGSEAVAKAFQESQAMAKAAGYPGITFLAMFGHESESGVAALLAEGYYGATNYHEWGKSVEMSKNPLRADYGNIPETVRGVWQEKIDRCGALRYYPQADTGWDSRPWHGDKSLVITGRTPERFEQVLRQARDFCQEKGREFVVLGPANEWGEGSYIEPNLEFGFDMMEAVRRVFAKGDAGTWPQNIGPLDVGLGPYDYPPAATVNAWTFDKDTGGWSGMMGVSALECRDGALVFQTALPDPAIMIGLDDLRAKRFTRAVIRMRMDGPLPANSGAQLFFSAGGQSISENTSYHFGLGAVGEMQTYTIDLSANPRWRGRIATLRFDPCNAADVTVTLDEFRLE